MPIVKNFIFSCPMKSLRGVCFTKEDRSLTSVRTRNDVFIRIKVVGQENIIRILPHYSRAYERKLDT